MIVIIPVLIEIRKKIGCHKLNDLLKNDAEPNKRIKTTENAPKTKYDSNKT